jgi:predicted hotdog family 3-hydroxylacyl-ACP dehydratase
MVLIDDAIDAGDDWALAGVRIAEDSPFYTPSLGGVPSWVGIEYMAQAVALFSGIQARQAGRGIKIGLLVGTRRYQVEADRFVLGSYLTIRVAREWDDGQMAVFDCQVADGRSLAAARINVYLPDDPQAFLEGREA